MYAYTFPNLQKTSYLAFRNFLYETVIWDRIRNDNMMDIVNECTCVRETWVRVNESWKWKPSFSSFRI